MALGMNNISIKLLALDAHYLLPYVSNTVKCNKIECNTHFIFVFVCPDTTFIDKPIVKF